jgi:hypothetical protein
MSIPPNTGQPAAGSPAVNPPKIANFTLTPDVIPFSEVGRGEFEKHLLTELQSLAGQHERATTEILRLQQRVTELQTTQAQIQGAIREVEAISTKCGIDLRKLTSNKN